MLVVLYGVDYLAWREIFGDARVPADRAGASRGLSSEPPRADHRPALHVAQVPRSPRQADRTPRPAAAARPGPSAAWRARRPSASSHARAGDVVVQGALGRRHAASAWPRLSSQPRQRAGDRKRSSDARRLRSAGRRRSVTRRPSARLPGVACQREDSLEAEPYRGTRQHAAYSSSGVSTRSDSADCRLAPTAATRGRASQVRASTRASAAPAQRLVQQCRSMACRSRVADAGRRPGQRIGPSGTPQQGQQASRQAASSDHAT